MVWEVPFSDRSVAWVAVSKTVRASFMSSPSKVRHFHPATVSAGSRPVYRKTPTAKMASDDRRIIPWNIPRVLADWFLAANW